MTDSTVLPEHVELRHGVYADSVALLQVSKDVAATTGVIAAQVAMATELNLQVIAGMGFTVPAASPDDMIVALRLDSEEALPAALDAVDNALAATRQSTAGSGSGQEAPPRTTGAALRRSAAHMAIISVPGPSATVEAMDALEAGKDVMIFSDNVPLSEEIALKEFAATRDLLVMGPDCGTAVVDGVGLGFANVMKPGPVGIVAASGTGCQQLLALLDYAGVGVSSALGVGGRDLSAHVRGISTKMALRRLDDDPAVELIVLVSKEPAPDVAAEVAAFARSLHTPVQLALLGPAQADLTQAAEEALAALGVPVPQWPVWGAAPTGRGAGDVRGLFAGGTLCSESMLLAERELGPVWSNISTSPAMTVDSTLEAEGTVMIDFGSDELTQGRPHPMIEPTLRVQHLAKVSQDPQVGVILLDVVLGHGADLDPAATIAPAISAAVGARRAAGEELPVIVSLIGTSGDPQGLIAQAEALAAAGAEVYLSNAHATRRALNLIGA